MGVIFNKINVLGVIDKFFDFFSIDRKKDLRMPRGGYRSGAGRPTGSLNKTTFNLDKVPFLSPLQGIIHLKLRCLMEVNIEERGFLVSTVLC